MKTSNKLIIAALFLVLASLVGYDYLLKAAYISGKYKDPYNGFVSLKNSGFDTVDLVSSTAANVKFIQGPFSVRIDPNALDYVRVKQTGKCLHINAVFESNYMSGPGPYVLVISCPKLAEIKTGATYRSNGRQVTDTIVRDDWKMRQVLIEGFNEDSILVRQNYGSTVVLSNNHIRTLKAVISTSDSSGSRIIIRKSNQFKHANITVLNRGSLMLDGKPIQNLNYQLADSAKMIFTGSAQNIINNSKPNQK